MLTIVLPTINKARFVRRLVKWLLEKEFRGILLVGDSSTNPNEAVETFAALSAAEGYFNTVYNAFPGLDGTKTTQLLSQKIVTPYCAYLGDDDYLCPGAADECIHYLELHTEYAGAHGHAFSMQVTNDSEGQNTIKALEYYPLTTRTEESSERRYLAHMQQYTVTLFCVVRSEIFKRAFQDAHNLLDRAFSGELLPSAKMVIEGRFALLNNFFLVRQSHEQRNFLPDNFDWISGADWRESWLKYNELLIEQLVQLSGIWHESAASIVKAGMAAYIKQQMQIHINPEDSANDLNTLQKQAFSLVAPEGTANSSFLDTVKSLLRWPNGIRR